ENSPPRKKTKEDDSMKPKHGSPSAVLRLEFDIEDDGFDAEGRFSSEAELNGTKWKLWVKQEECSPFVEVYLLRRTCDPGLWSIDVSAEFRIVGRGGVAHRVQKLNETFHNGQARGGCDKFIRSNEFTYNEDSELLTDDFKLVIEVEFSLSNFVGISSAFDFTDPADPRHNVSLVFDTDEKIHASKQILAIHSPVFNVMFFGDFAEKNK
ncbi:hypothetical protein PMAYCL1PPCAC_24877, partial [Pristionchus mayeri]